MNVYQRFVRQEDGQGLVEYGLIIGLISLVAIMALTSSGTSITGMFGTISGKMETVSGSVSAAS